ncbi:MAG: Ig-like domain-containing protein [Bacteroidaceae bacterium]|nr:Ig-like domain-containing protein [Bacteroidaceae bacterium]
MMTRIKSFITKALRSTLLLLLSLVSLSASAEWLPVELDKLYDEPNIWNNQTDFKFTPTESGTLTVWSQDAVMHVYSQLNADETDLVYESQISSFGYASNTFEGVTFSKRTTSQVEAGKTYYITSSAGFSKDMKFYLSMQTGITNLELVKSSQPAGEMFNITDERDGQLELEFNLPATADAWATLRINDHVTDSIETRQDVNSGKLIFELKDSLYSWMQKEYYKAGDKMTLTITGLCAKTNQEIKYGTDGTLVMEWTVPGKPHYLLSLEGAEPFKSYWVPGDKDGIVTLTFDYPLMTKENGQTAGVKMQMGSADMGDAYEGYLDQEKISVDGNKLLLDFTGVRRAYEDLGLKMKWGSISLKVHDILMEDGTSSFNETSGNYGSAAFDRSYVELKSDIVAEFTPASGSQLTEKAFKVYFSEKDSYKFDGVELYYQTQEDEKYMVEVTEGITSVEEGDNGIEYTIPVPDEVFAGKNIRVEFMNVTSIDGFEHDFGVKYNPGPELTDDLNPASRSLMDGDVVASLNDIRLTFEEDVFVNSEGILPIYVTDLTTQQQVAATMAVDASDSKTVVITPTESLKDCHEYEFMINYSAIVNKEYVETNGKYGRYYKGEFLKVTLSSLYGNYDFAAAPLPGATVSQLDRIAIYTKPNASFDTEFISPTRREDRFVWVETEAGEKVAECTVKDDVTNGFSINLAEPITESGKYFVVLQDSVYNMGEGYTMETNDSEVRIPYNILKAPEATITITAADPTSETKVEALESITLVFSEWVYADECQVQVLNKSTYVPHSATLTVNPKNRNMAVINFTEGALTDEGSYTITIPEASVGDQLWYESEGMTGKMNETINLYYTIGTDKGGDEPSFFTTDPTNNSTVESLSHIKITFDSDAGIGSGVITVKKDGEKVATVDALYDDDWNNVIDFHIYYTATEDGVYTFEVPEGYFLDASGNARPAFTLTYTIGEEQEPTFFTTDPENNSAVESLSHIKITFDSEAGIGSGVITVKKDGEKVTTVDALYDDDWNNVTDFHIYYTASEDGVYTFEVPEGYFLDASGNARPAFTLTYTVSGGQKAPEATITITASDPTSETKVEALESITLVFSEWVYADECQVQVLNKSTYVPYSATLTINPKNRSMAVINFADGALTDEGSYTITIPEASVGDQLWYESEGTTGKMNETINLYYTIGKDQGGDDDGDWKTDPANNSTVTSLYEIHVWNTTVSEMGCGSGKAIFKRDGVELEHISDASYGIDWNELVIRTSKDYTEDGIYTLEVPEGFFLDGTGNALPAVTFTWTIGEAQEETSDYVTDPANNSTVTSLYEIHVWNTTVSEMGCGSGKAVFKRDGVELEQISDASYGIDWNELVIRTSKDYTEDGVYTLEVPEGFFLDGSGQALPAVTFTWTIAEGDGIQSIKADSKQAVYTLDGRKANASQRGIIIKGGKKVLVK